MLKRLENTIQKLETLVLHVKMKGLVQFKNILSFSI